MDWLHRMRLRKFGGLLAAVLTGVFSVVFLMLAAYRWTPIPEGVVPVLGVLAGMFGGYAGSSSYEAVRRRGNEHEGE